MPVMANPERDVLTSLPNSRPTRRSPKRDAAAAATKPKAAKPAAKKPAAAKPKAAVAKPKATPKPKPAAAPKAAAKRSKVGVPKGQTAPKQKVAAAAAPVEPGTIPAAGWATHDPAPAKSAGGFNTDDLFGTAMTAVTQIAQIGLASISQNAKSMLDKLPRP